MAKFRKKPVVIDAEQFGPGMSDEFKTAVCLKTECKGLPVDGMPHIHTLEGHHMVRPSDWLIKGVKGEFYPCRPDIFEQTYEPA